MSIASSSRGRRLAASALAKAEAFLLEPVEAAARPAAITLRPVVAVVALATGCGTTTVARAAAVELARRDSSGAAAVAGAATAGPLAVAGSHAGRLARAVGAGAGERVRAVGRLCLVEGCRPEALAGAVRHLAPLVIEVPYGDPAGVAVSLADHVLLVASPGVEPALATAVAASLAGIGPRPQVVLNRAIDDDNGDVEGWARGPVMRIRRSAAGARLALVGRDPRGALGGGVAEIADACAAVRSEW